MVKRLQLALTTINLLVCRDYSFLLDPNEPRMTVPRRLTLNCFLLLFHHRFKDSVKLKHPGIREDFAKRPEPVFN